MADYTLIDEYLGQLRQKTRRLRDVEEITEEVADHLLQAVDRRIARGSDRVTAQRRTLEEFGDPDLVGRAFASSRTGGATMPTQFTRRAGYALIVSAFLWVAGAGFFVASNGANFGLYLTGASALLAALLLGAVGVLGVSRRHGGSLGWPARIGFWLLVVALVTFFPANTYDVPWQVFMTAFALGAVLVGVAVTRSDIAPRISGVLIGVGAVVLSSGVWIGEAVNSDAWAFVGYSALLAFALGEAVLGRWMATEDVDDSEPLVAA